MTFDQEQRQHHIAAMLREHRARQRPPISQFEMAGRVRIDGKQVSYRQYQRWENEKSGAGSMPTWRWMQAIADELGCTVDDLLGVNDEQPAATRPEAADEGALEDLTGRLESALQQQRDIQDRQERLAERLEQLLSQTQAEPAAGEDV